MSGLKGPRVPKPAPAAEVQRAPALPASEFDAAYYERFYENSATQVHGAARIAQLGLALTTMLSWFGQEVRSVLEVGAGPGYLRDWFAREQPAVRYVSTEHSEYARARYAHSALDIGEQRLRERFDLVVCQGVLQYLDAAAAARAIANLGAMTRGFLYLEVVTEADAKNVCDVTRSDLSICLRRGSWYRRELLAHYREVGCGLYCANENPLTFYELEAAPRKRAKG